MNFETGIGKARVNETCFAGGSPCADAKAFGDGNNLSSNVVGNTITINGSIKNSILPFSPSLDFDLSITALEDGGIIINGTRNPFPSLEISRGDEFLFTGGETTGIDLFDFIGGRVPFSASTR